MCIRDSIIIGRSGGGKSVLLKHLIGLLQPDAGEVLVNSQNIVPMNERQLLQVRRMFGMVFQGAALFEMCIRDSGLGNLVNRSLSMLKRYRNGIVPARSNELAADAAKAADETRALFKQSQLQAALQSIWGLVNRANQYVDQTKPFSLAKDPAQAQRLDEVLYNLAETCLSLIHI